MHPPCPRPRPVFSALLPALAATLAAAVLVAAPAADARPVATAAPPAPAPSLGAHTLVFAPSMPVADIQERVDDVAAQQIGNQFGPERWALLFEPGTYGSATEPLNIEVGYYTEVAGLGQDPGDVTINGSVDVHNQCENGSCIALNNFWRSASNLTINVTKTSADCDASANFWAVSQAAPLRRVRVTGGNLSLMDYCSGPSFASGGFIADSDLPLTINGSQQQFFTRDSRVASWTNGVWNQVFSGVDGAPAECFGVPGCGPYTTEDTTSVSREKPYLYVDDAGRWRVFVPAAGRDTHGTTWAVGSTPGRSLPLSDFYVASPGDSARTINSQLARGRHLLLTPGVYDLASSLQVRRAGTVVLGLGLPSLIPTHGTAAVTVADVPSVDLAGFSVDAGPVRSPYLVQVGSRHGRGASTTADPAQPSALQDVFFRIGGPHLGRARTSLEVNSDHVVLDDVWAWRADHGEGVGWTQNTADTGLVVNGDDVTATGLFVEHYQKDEVVWNGERGRVLFFQNELPYDPPSQAAWRSAPGHDGYPALRVSAGVKDFRGSGMGSYSFFNQGVDVFAENAFEVPQTPGVRLHDLLTIFLDPSTGKGGIRHVVNGVGGSSTIANPDVPVTVVDYP